MSNCFDYDFQKWTMISLSSIAITLIVGLIILLNPFAHGQNDSSSRVDKIIGDTKRDNADKVKEQEYRTELIDRIRNSNCTEDFEKVAEVQGYSRNRLPDLSADDMKNMTLGDFREDDIAALQGQQPNITKHESFILKHLNMTNLENYFKLCVREGKIK